MIKTSEYAKLERQMYKFTLNEIRDALCGYYDIRQLGRVILDLFDTEQDKDGTMAELTISYEYTEGGDEKHKSSG